VLKLNFPIHGKKCCEKFAKFLVHELEGKSQATLQQIKPNSLNNSLGFLAN